MNGNLRELVVAAAHRDPSVADADGTLSYGRLDAVADPGLPGNRTSAAARLSTDRAALAAVIERGEV